MSEYSQSSSDTDDSMDFSDYSSESLSISSDSSGFDYDSGSDFGSDLSSDLSSDSYDYRAVVSRAPKPTPPKPTPPKPTRVPTPPKPKSDPKDLDDPTLLDGYTWLEEQMENDGCEKYDDPMCPTSIENTTYPFKEGDNRFWSILQYAMYKMPTKNPVKVPFVTLNMDLLQVKNLKKPELNEDWIRHIKKGYELKFDYENNFLAARYLMRMPVSKFEVEGDDLSEHILSIRRTLLEQHGESEVRNFEYPKNMLPDRDQFKTVDELKNDNCEDLGNPKCPLSPYSTQFGFADRDGQWYWSIDHYLIVQEMIAKGQSKFAVAKIMNWEQKEIEKYGSKARQIALEIVQDLEAFEAKEWDLDVYLQYAVQRCFEYDDSLDLTVTASIYLLKTFGNKEIEDNSGFFREETVLQDELLADDERYIDYFVTLHDSVKALRKVRGDPIPEYVDADESKTERSYGEEY